MRPVCLLIATTVLALAASPARALNFFELEVYPATTEGKGLHEIESTTTFVGNGRKPTDEELNGETPVRHRLFRTTLEYNYGLTDKIDVAAYLDLDRPDGRDLEYAGNRLRFRGALFDKGRFPVDLGWYFEAEMPHNAPSDLDLEFRPLLSRDFGRFTVNLNPTFELPTVTVERRTLEFKYSAGITYRLSKNLQPGLEFFGDMGQIRQPDLAKDQEHYIFPVVYGRLGHGVKFSVGPGFGLTRASDPVILKLGVEYEFSL